MSHISLPVFPASVLYDSFKALTAFLSLLTGHISILIFNMLSFHTFHTLHGNGIQIELYSKPKRWCYERAALNMPANLEKSAVATELEKVSFHSNP